MQKIVSQYLDYLAHVKRRSVHTVTSYENDLTVFLNFMIEEYEVEQIESISHLMIRSWLVDLRTQGLSNVSINRKISALKSFYRYLKKKELIVVNPMAKVLTLKKSKRLPSFVPKKKMEYLLEPSIEEKADISCVRNELIIMLLYMTGMRRSELINIMQRDINEARLDIKVTGKGNKERLCPITKEVMAKIEEYISLKIEHFGNIDHDYLLVTDKGKPCYPKLIFNVVSKVLKRINASEKTSPHVLRHTFATHLSANGAELNAVKELLGHASLAATQVYTHNTIERLKKEYKRAHPKGE